MKTPFQLARLLLPAALSVATAAAATLVSAPPSAVSGDLNAGNRFPFDPSYPFSASFMRYQQGYAASFFLSVASEPVWITGMRFRGDGAPGATSGPFSGTIADIRIELSTTARPADGLSSTFNQNIGADVTTVHPRGPLALASGYAPDGNGARVFDITVTFSTPFLYDPLLGNLLLDVTNHSGDRMTPVNWIAFDAVDTAGDGISRVWSTSSGAASGTVQSLGLVTQFVTTPVPEPALAGMLGLTVLIGAFGRRRPAVAK